MRREVDLTAIYCFCDTNVLIHFQTFDEVDWPVVLRASEVYLVLAPIVIAELSQYKDDSTSGWRQRRTRTLVSKLKALLNETTPGIPIELRPGVFLLDIPREPSVDWTALGLDPQINDDRLLATIIEFSEQHRLERIVLVSDDFLAQRKARSQGIAVIEPDGLIDRIVRSTPEISRIRNLEQQILELKKRIPELEFYFRENGEATNTAVRQIKITTTDLPSDEESAQEVAQKKQKLKEIITKARRASIEETEIQKFVRNYETYITAFETALKAQRSREYGARCPLAFILKNTGSSPALNVDIELYFPPESFVVGASREDDELFGEVQIPFEPESEWFKFTNSLTSSIYIPAAISRSQPYEPPRPRGPLYDYADRSFVSFNHPSLRHKEHWSMEAVIVYLPPTTEGGFQIRYSIHADNLLEPIEGCLNVILNAAYPAHGVS